jgi:histidyl-tRNA synthetase
MSSKVQPVRGTQDFLPEMSAIYRGVENIAFKNAQLFGFSEIMTPLFEFSEVFHRSLGETSDAVSKETYDFMDRGGDHLTLRPEGTAGVVRAFISNGLTQNLPLKLFYSGPMFRYERPQKGRYRQFHQIGVEAIGFESASIDAECIALAFQILSQLGLTEKVKLEINTLGDRQSRESHRQALLTYLQPLKSQLSADSQIRLEKNPLRILDSKDEGDKKLLLQAPSLQTHLNDESKKFFAEVLHKLELLNIKYVINDKLVRGLDYYTHTVFEITTDQLGAQGAVVAGGRYDGLIEQMGGPATSGFGWGAGLERLMLLTEPGRFTDQSKLIAIIPADDKSENYCFQLTSKLRHAGHRSEFLGGGNVGKKMKRANKLGARYALIVGETELQQNVVAVKDLLKGEQKNVPAAEILNFFGES